MRTVILKTLSSIGWADDLDHPADGILPAHENGRYSSVVAANRFERARRGKLEFMRHLPRFAQRKRRHLHLLLHRFLPGLVKLLADPEIRHDFKFRLDLRRHLRDRRRQKFPPHAPWDGESGR